MNIENLLTHCREHLTSSDGKTWYPARAHTAENTFLWLRVKAAWRVLVGRSDAVEWEPKP